LPCAVFATYIKNLSIDNFRLRWEEPSAVWREGILLNNVENIDLNNLHLRQPQDDNGAAINCQDVQDISLRNNRAASGTSTFIHIANSNKSTFVRYGGNDFSHAATALSQTGKKVDLIPLKDLN
jgi:hypothetical protein